MRVLVIGGTGFIGAPLVRRLHSAGHAVTVYHRGVHEPALPDGVRHVRSEMAAHPVVAFPDELLRASFDSVVHMTLTGERDAAAAVEAFAGRAGRLVVASSGDVYAAHGQVLGIEPAPSIEPGAAVARGAERAPALLTEDAPLRAGRYPYGRRVAGPWGELVDYDKILAEEVVRGAPDLPGTVLRLPAVYGPGDRQRRFRPWLTRMAAGRPAIVLGAGEARWRWTHGYVENVAAALALGATHPGAAGRVYNVGEAEAPTVAERVAAVGRAAGWDGRAVAVPDGALPAHLRTPYRYDANLAYDTTRIRAELGYVEPVDAEAALHDTVAWERAHPPEVQSPVDYIAEDEALAGAT